MALARKLLAHAPRPVVGQLRQARRTARRLRYRTRHRVNPVTVDLAAVVEALHDGGLGTGDAVFFQSAMSSLGHIEQGPTTVLEALDRTVGSRGLISMPAFPVVGSAVEYLESRPVFDVRTTPSTMGAITESFRQRQGTIRSIHPTHSIAARGPGAEDLVVNHHRALTPFGVGTPFASLIDRDAYQVWFGCGVRAFTMYHAFECLRSSFPLEVFLDRRFAVDCVDWDGSAITVSTLVHDPAISQHRIDVKPSIAERWRSLLIDRGVLCAVPLGRGEILTVRLQRMMAELERLLAEGVTIYDVSLPGQR